MATDIIEYSSVGPLMGLVDEIVHTDEGLWGIACIKRGYLKPMTNEAFLLAMKPALQEAHTVSVFFITTKRIYIIWCGDRKAVYKHMHSLITTTLIPSGMEIEASAIISYIDPRVSGIALLARLRAEYKQTQNMGSRQNESKAGAPSDMDFFGFDDDGGAPPVEGPAISLSVTPEQIGHFNEIKNQRPYRKRMQILVAEDQLFSQKLLCEIIRGARITGRDVPIVDAVQGIQDAWKLFLKKAHDILYVDLGLIDGSGHALARAVKELDPTTPVIIVTANNYAEELGVAQQNNVDGFIVKPYNKKQILDCIDKYVGSRKGDAKGGAHGSSSQF